MVDLLIRLEAAQQGFRVFQLRETVGTDQRAALAARQQRGEPGAGILLRNQRTGAACRHQTQGRGDAVVRIQVVTDQLQPADMPRRRPLTPPADRHTQALIDDHPLEVVIHPPGCQQRAKVRGAAIGHTIHHGFLALVHFRYRIDKGQQAPAAQDKLVNGEQRRFGQCLGVHQQQHFNILGNLIDIMLQGCDAELLTDLLESHPGRHALPGHRVHPAIHRQPADHADLRLFRL